MKRYYFCYDATCKNFLMSQGLKYITKALHPETFKTFWLWEQTPEFNESMKTWERIKNQSNK